MKKGLFFIATAVVLLCSNATAQDVRVKYNDKIDRWCFMNIRSNVQAGDIVLGGSMEYVRSYEGSWYYIVKGLNDMIGVVKSPSFSIWLIDCNFSDIHFLDGFSDYGLFLVKKKGSYGVMDASGKMLIPCEYQRIINEGNTKIQVRSWDNKDVVLRMHDIVRGVIDLTPIK